MEKIPEHGPCFVCGTTNPKSIGVEWQLEPGNQISALFRFSESQQGPPGFVHGGASAAVLDEAMGLALFQAGYRAVTASLMVEYRKPVPLGEQVKIQAGLSGKMERRMVAMAEILLPDGSVAVSAKGAYAEANHFFENSVKQYLEARK